MVTGIEVAGIVLSSFPVAIAGLKFYANGAQSVADLRRYRQVLENFGRDLAIERCIFNNTCSGLLEDAVSDHDLKKLMDEPGGPQCQAQNFRDMLAGRLRGETVSHFMSTVDKLQTAVQKVEHTYRIPPNNEHETPGGGLIQSKLKEIGLVALKSHREEQIRQIRNLNEDLRRLIGSPRPTNLGQPSKLVVKSAADYYRRIRSHIALLYIALKDRFWAQVCGCVAPHCASLQLEMRRIEARQNRVDSDVSFRFKFVFSFECPPQTELPWKWQELELEQLENVVEFGMFKAGVSTIPSSSGPPEPDETEAIGTVSRQGQASFRVRMQGYIPENFKISISKRKSKKLSSQNPSPQPPPELLIPAAEHDQTVDLNLLADNREPIPSGSQAQLSPATTQLQIIKNLCSTIKDLEVNSSYYYLGILNDDKLQRKHRVWLPRVNTTTPTPQPTGETTSLQSLLSNSSQSPPSRKDRLQLGVKLASSVMQLHDTAWLDESWGKDDIIFPLAILESVDRDDTPKPLLNKPLVRQIFKSIVNASTTAKYVSVVHCNKSLFSLGIILIELLFWKTIEDMQSPEESSSKNLADSTADYLTAIRLIDSIYDDAGTSYGDAVRRCIKGLDLRETNLESDDFKNEVYSKVLYPLEENLKTFCNWKELPEIL